MTPEKWKQVFISLLIREANYHDQGDEIRRYINWFVRFQIHISIANITVEHLKSTEIWNGMGVKTRDEIKIVNRFCFPAAEYRTQFTHFTLIIIFPVAGQYSGDVVVIIWIPPIMGKQGSEIENKIHRLVPDYYLC